VSARAIERRGRRAINVRDRGDSGSGDIIDLVQFLDDCDFIDACKVIIGEIPHTARAPLPDFPLPPKPRDAGLWRNIWDTAILLEETLGWTYLTGSNAHGGRALEIPDGVSGRALRFHPKCPWRDGFVPAVVGLYRNVLTDSPQGIIRIGLTSDGRKIDRMDLGVKTGGAIKLQPATDRICIAESVENALAAAMLGHGPVWAVGGSGGIGNFPVIDGVNKLVCLLDNDKPPFCASQNAGRKVGECWAAAGRDVQFDMPEIPGQDFNDLIG
jgi:putative DNA primase/helicase